jgi:hypothetical protein
MTEKGHSDAKLVAIELCGAIDGGVTTEQAETLKRLVDEEDALYTKVRAAIYRQYMKSYSTYKQAWLMGSVLFRGDANEISKVLPEIVKGNELDGLVSFGTIYVSPPEKGVSRIGVSLHCPWDEEHGMGVRIAGRDVEEVGDAGSAMAGFMPRPPGLTDLAKGNVAIYVANMAYEPRSVDIDVQIDGVPVVTGNFEHDLRTPYSRYLVSLAPGEHRLKVDSKLGQASSEEVFRVKDQVHAGVAFYHSRAGLLNQESKPIFTLHFDERPWIPERGWRPGK